jgi:ubiquinone/menaquinone biosynthesis C-methylase UbiE
MLEAMTIQIRRRAVAALLVCAMAAPAAMHARQAPQHPTSTPYTGDLSIFEYKDRDQKLQIQRVMDLLGIRPGSSVADIGAGSGWFTARASQRVGPSGKVFAEDINPEAVKAIAQRAQKEGLANVQTIQGTPDDPELPKDSVDAVLLLKVYHEVAHTNLLLRNLKPALKPGAKIGIIDRNGTGDDHGLNEAIVVKEMTAAGFQKVGRYDFTKADGQDYFLIFTLRQ